MRKKSGEYFPADIKVSLFRTGGDVVSVTAIIANIAERKLAEQELAPGVSCGCLGLGATIYGQIFPTSLSFLLADIGTDQNTPGRGHGRQPTASG